LSVPASIPQGSARWCYNLNISEHASSLKEQLEGQESALHFYPEWEAQKFRSLEKTCGQDSPIHRGIARFGFVESQESFQTHIAVLNSRRPSEK
jgi:hypothetical protein